MPNPLRAGGPGFLGAKHAPFVIESDPVQPDFQVAAAHVIGHIVYGVLMGTAFGTMRMMSPRPCFSRS